MLSNYNAMIKPYHLLGLFILLAFGTTNASANNGCVISQTSNLETLVMSEGTIGQTFTPCQAGTLQYIQLWVESTDASTFSVQMSVYDGDQMMTSQQLVIPSKGQSNHVRAWMAQPPMLEEGKEYNIVLQVPTGHSFYTYYNPTNAYAFGKMTINSLLTFGDLAFEAGIKSAKTKTFFSVQERNSNSCLPDNIEAVRNMDAQSLESQTFRLCETVRAEALELQYKALRDIEGTVSIRKAYNEEAPALFESEFFAPASQNPTTLSFDLELLELYDETIYEITLNTEEEGLLLFYSDVDPYPHGQMFTSPHVNGNDLAFNIEVYEPEVEEEEEEVFYAFTQHPDHDCMVSQPYWNEWKTIQGPATMEVEIPVCDDGELEGLYMKYLSDDDITTIAYSLYGANGAMRAGGFMVEAENEISTLYADLKGIQAVGYLNYKLGIAIPEGVSIDIAYSTSDEHDGFWATVDGTPMEGNLAYATGMKPYTFNFEEVSADKKDIAVNVFPNPFVNDFNLEIDGLKGKVATITMYDFQGNQVYQNTMNCENEKQLMKVIPAVPLTKGYHTLRIEYDDQVVLETVLKQ